jgi:integrase
MTPRARPKAPTGLVWRDGRAYFDRRHQRFKDGRLAISLRTSDPDVAGARHSVIVSLMDRGDWAVIEAIRSGEMHISDAQAALRDGDAKKLRRMGAGTPKLGDAVERFLRRKEATRAGGTVSQYRSRLQGFRDEMGDDLEMDAFTSTEAAAYLQAPKPAKPWAPTTQESVRVCLGALWNMVMEEEAEALALRNVHPSITLNPWSGLEMPELRPTRTAFLTPAEWRTLDASMTRQPYRALVAIAFLAGLRQGEIRYLRPGVDVLLEGDPLIRVQSRKGDRPWRPKTKRGQRDVPITATLVGIIQEHHNRGYAGERYLIRTANQDTPVSTGTAERWTEEAYTRAGIRYGRDGDALTLHSGRHTYASWMAQDGVPLNVIATLLGDTTKVVEETYAHLVPDTYRAAVQNIERRAKALEL